MNNNLNKFTSTKTDTYNNGKKFSVKKDKLQKDAEDIKAERLGLSIFATEALASIGYLSFSVAHSLNNGISGVTIAALPAAFFAFDGIKKFIKFHKYIKDKDKKLLEEANEKEMIENEEKGMKL